MKKVLVILLLAVVIPSCKQNRKETNVEQLIVEIKVDSIGIFNNILKDLIDNHLYNRYLGRNAELLMIDLFNKKIDSTAYLEKLHILKNNIVTMIP